MKCLASRAMPSLFNRGDRRRPGFDGVKRGRPAGRRRFLAWAVILCLALAVRMPGLRACLPYSSYVDEGHLLHRVTGILASGDWDPGWYYYPTLPIYAVTAAAALYSPLHPHLHGTSLRSDLSMTPYAYYDIVQPTAVLLAGRATVLLFSLGIVVMAGVLAASLGGAAGGLAAAFIAALVPALVIRSTITSVDACAAFFVLAALCAAPRAAERGASRRTVFLAGLMAGLAFASKYTAGLVLLALAASILTSPVPFRERFARLALVVAGAGVAAAAAMPALVFRTGAVITHLKSQAGFYAGHAMGSYWRQALLRAEWDLPFDHPELGFLYILLFAAAALTIARDRMLAPVLGPWLLYAALHLFVLTRYPFRPFRNMLPLVPLSCVVIGVCYGRIRSRTRFAGLLDIGLAAGAITLFGLPLLDYGYGRMECVDTRSRAVEWLAGRDRQDAVIFFQDEIAVMPNELATLSARTFKTNRQKTGMSAEAGEADFLVIGNMREPDGSVYAPCEGGTIPKGYLPVKEIGSTDIPSDPGFWRGNDLALCILGRKEKSRRP